MTIISMMIDDCPLEMIYDSLLGSRAVSIGRSQIETLGDAVGEPRLAGHNTPRQ